MAAPTRPVADCVTLSHPIVHSGAERTTVDVYAVRIGDLEGLDLGPLFDAIGMTPDYMSRVLSASADAPPPDPVPNLGALLGCSSTLRRLLERITPLAPPQIASIDARDLLRIAEVIVPLLLGSGPAGDSAGP